MAIFTRFECPRCQHVFVTEGDADAFADCPKCQSMALAIGEASSATVQGVPRGPTLGTGEGAPLAGTGGFSERTSDADKGVFSQLLESTDSFAAQPDPRENLRVPATLDDMPPAESPSDPFDESTVAAEAPSILLTRMMSDESGPVRRHEARDESVDYSDEEEVHRAPTEVLRPRRSSEPTAVRAAPEQQRTEDLGSPFSDNELDSAFDLPADDEDAWENGPPPGVPQAASAAVLDEDAWENGPPEGVPGGAPLPRPPSTGEIPRRVSNAALDLTRDEPSSGFGELSLELHEEQGDRGPGPAARRGVWDPNFHSGEMKAGAVLLSDLESGFGGVRLDEAASAGDLSGSELNALEQAFSQMAGGAPASRAEDALRQASVQAASSLLAIPTHSQLQGTAVPVPPAEGEPPALTRRQRPAHLSLSEEAKALAGIPIQPAAGSHNLALELTRGAPKQAANETPPPRPRAPDDDGGARPAEGRPSAPSREQSEVTDAVRPARARQPVAAEPGTFAGFTLARVAALALVAILLGLGGGIVIAPSPAPKPTTPRTRAEQQFSQGNQFYAEGRFDDALGSYRGAIALDRTFAPAHRAKAAALAKQQRGEEAASAYRAYLETSPGAVDAQQVREVLRRYEGEATP